MLCGPGEQAPDALWLPIQLREIDADITEFHDIRNGDINATTTRVVLTIRALDNELLVEVTVGEMQQV